MKPEKTLILDVNPEKNPGYHYAKNIVLTDKFDAYSTEPGFKKLHDFSPNTPVGFIPLDEDDFIVFLDNDTIWYCSITNELVQKITGADFNFNFSKDTPIQGKFKYNYKRQLIITWVQPNQPPRILNVGYKPSHGATNDVLTAQDVDDINDTLLFPSLQVPLAEVSLTEGGNIEVGAYFFSIQYENVDGSITPPVRVIGPFWVGDEAVTAEDYDGADEGTASNKALRIDFKRLDSRFKKVVIGVIKYTDAKLETFRLQGREISPSGTVVSRYTGAESTTTTTLEELTVPPVGYNSAKAIEQLNNQLWLGNLGSRQEFNFQPIANNITIKWTSTLKTITDPKQNSKSNFTKGFMHGEVYAFYIQFVYKDGSTSRAFHIPGPIGNVTSLSQIRNDSNFNENLQEAVDIAAEQDVVARRFHFYEDNVSVGDNDLSAIPESEGLFKFTGGTMGCWYNEYEDLNTGQIIDEKYPTEGGFPTGPVRHHKFPSLDFIADNVWGSEQLKHGLQTFDVLGIQVEGVNIPEEIVDEIDGYRILYAKRDFDNAQVLGQDILQYAAYNKVTDASGLDVVVKNTLPTSEQAEKLWPTAGSQIVTNAGNWHMGYNKDNFTVYKVKRLALDVLRCHNFDLLKSQAAVNVTHIRRHTQYTKLNLALQYSENPKSGGWLNNSASGKIKGGRFCVLSDYTYQSRRINDRPSQGSRIVKVEDHKYVPHGGFLDSFAGREVQNFRSEACLLLKLRNKSASANRFDERLSLTSLPLYMAVTRGNENLQESNGVNNEYTAHYSIMSFTPLPYDSFLTRELVQTDVYQPVESAGTQPVLFAHGGDVYTGLNSIITSAFKSDIADASLPPFDNPRCIKVFPLNTINNVSMRHSNEDDIYTRYYPKTNPTSLVLTGDTGNIETISSDIPFKIIYNEGYTQVNDEQAFPIYNPKFKNTSEFPFRIIGSDLENPEAAAETWKNFQPLNYYETVRNKGEIKALVSNGIDLLIHHEYGLFKTRSRGKIDLNLDNFQAELGTGQLFAAPPVEVIPADTAYAGISHWSNGVKFKGGYFFVDPNMGKVFLFSEGLQEVSNFGFRHFSRENLRNRGQVFSNHISVGFDERFNRFLISQANPSFTLSYSLDHQGLASFHSWIADMIINTSNFVVSLKDKSIYLHNDNYEGKYYENEINSSFIDIVFANDDIFRFQAVEWRTKTDQKGQTLENAYNISIDEISAWNSSAHTGPIKLKRKQTIGLDSNIRNVEGEWKFNIFRDNLNEGAEGFIKPIEADFNVDESQLNLSKAWFRKRRFSDRFVIVRFKWNSDKLLYLIDVEPTIVPLTR